MAKTAQDVITFALRRLNVIGNGETASGDIYDDALSDYLVFHEWGRSRYPRNWSWNYDAVDDRYWTNVAAIFAEQLIDGPGISEAARDRAVRGADRARLALHDQFSKTPLAVAGNDYY